MNQTILSHLGPERVKNLIRLAKYFAGELKATFDISIFAEDDNAFAIECGSVGCAVGHGPYAGINKGAFETWYTYARRCFIRTHSGFQFLFGSSWGDTVWNRPENVVDRIWFLLKHGMPDKDWTFGAFKTMPLNIDLDRDPDQLKLL